MSEPTLPAPPAAHLSPLRWWDWLGLSILFVVVVLFGYLVERRSAFQARPMTDLDVYLRAAWAVRTGQDLYSITDDNGWHYHYPSLLAILLVPFADPPAGVERSGTLPFALTVALWYAFSVLCLGWAAHQLASALEQTAADPAVRRVSPRSRRWWVLRVIPVLACLVPIGHTLMRGQVNLLLLALLCGMAAAWLRGRRLQAGLWLAGAICLKIIPAFLLIYPLWRRDGRCLAGCALGLLLGLGVIPTLVFGPRQTLAYYLEWDEALRRPALAGGTDSSRQKELIEITATDSQSFQAAIHNTVHFDRWTRPAHPSWTVRAAHWSIGGLLTGLTLLAAGWRRRSPATELVFFGALLVLMALLSPVCHLHYFCLLVPLVMGLRAAMYDTGSSLVQKSVWWLLIGINLVADALPNLQGMEVFRDVGSAMYAAVLWCLVGAVVLRRSRHSQPMPQAERAGLPGLAA
jgi:hypothetical protein